MRSLLLSWRRRPVAPPEPEPLEIIVPDAVREHDARLRDLAAQLALLEQPAR